MKPVKIRLSQGDLRAQGMYILLEENEEKYTKNGITSPPNRTYKIEIAVETVVNNKRCRGKRSFNIPKGTSITKAIESLLGKKDELIKTLKDKGSLKIEKIVIDKKDTKSRVLNDLFDIWINKKKINKKPNTVRVYSVYYNAHVKENIGKKIIDDITEHDIQIEVINTMVNANLGGNTIQGMKRILKPLFEENDKLLNWKKIELPNAPKARKYYKSKEDTLKIVETLNNYYHPIARGVFKFLLTGRRVNEVLYLTHENLNYKDMKFTILAKYAKTNKDFDFPLTQTLIEVIKEQKTKSGRIFKLEHRMILEHFKSAMNKICIYDMVVHDIRSMVAQTALDNGADIYDVSKMLAHQKVATTEASYIEGGLNQAKKAQEVFQKAIQIDYKEFIEKAEIIEDKFSVIKNLYPNVNDEIIKYVISILEGRILIKSNELS
jgi:site-specific recombinase XerD